MTKLSKLFASLLASTLILGIISTFLIANNFAATQLSNYSASNPGITKVTIAWPRLISEPNDIAKFEKELADWEVKSNFLIFRAMSDRRGNSFYLVGTKSPESFYEKNAVNTPTNCDLNRCEVIAAYPDGAQVPDVAGMGLVIVNSTLLANKVPIPKDFGIDPRIPILITSQVEELSNWEPGRYLPATYGWQISPSNSEKFRTGAYKEALTELESNLTSQFPNVAVNYPLNKLDKLIANQEHFSSLINQAIKILFLVFLILLILLFASNRFRRRDLFIFICLILLIQQLWNFSTLAQISIFLILALSLFYFINRVLDSRLVKRDFQTLALFRSSFRSIASISLLSILFSATLLSSFQYLNRTQEIRKQFLDAKVPYDFTLKIGSSLDRPLDLGSLSEMEALATNTKAIPVIKNTATLIDKSGDEKQINLLALGKENLWNEPRILLPAGRTLKVQTSGIPREIDLIVWLRTESGAHQSLTATRTGIRTAKLPSSLDRYSIVAFELQENPINAARREHALGESTGRAFDTLNGLGQITSISVDGTSVEVGKEWPINDFSFALIDGPLTLRPETAENRSDITFSTGLAKSANEIRLNDQISIPIKKASDGNFAGAERPFAIIDLADYQAYLSRTDPGSIDPLEVWIQSENPTQFLANFSISKFQTLKLINRSELENFQNNSPYWKSWKMLHLSTFFFTIILILITLLYFSQLLRDDFRKKSFEFVNYFASGAPSIKSLNLTFVICLFGGIPILILSRILAGLLS